MPHAVNTRTLWTTFSKLWAHNPFHPNSTKPRRTLHYLEVNICLLKTIKKIQVQVLTILIGTILRTEALPQPHCVALVGPMVVYLCPPYLPLPRCVGTATRVKRANMNTEEERWTNHLQVRAKYTKIGRNGKLYVILWTIRLLRIFLK